MNGYRAYDPWFKDHQPDMYMTMIETAETVASRYNISRDTWMNILFNLNREQHQGNKEELSMMKLYPSKQL